MDDRVMVQVRLPRDLVKCVDHLAVDSEWNRGETIAFLVRLGLRYAEDELRRMADNERPPEAR